MKIEREGKTVAIYNAEEGSFRKGKSWTWLSSNFKNVNVLIRIGYSIEFCGEHTSGSEGIKFSKIFRIGDMAEYGSYNLIYTGSIERIGEKTIKIIHYPDNTDSRKSMLRIDEFISRNYDFDIDEIGRKNADTMQYI